MKTIAHRYPNDNRHTGSNRTYLSIVMTGLAQVLFPWRANGSLVTDEKGRSLAPS